MIELLFITINVRQMADIDDIISLDQVEFAPKIEAQ